MGRKTERRNKKRRKQRERAINNFAKQLPKIKTDLNKLIKRIKEMPEEEFEKKMRVLQEQGKIREISIAFKIRYGKEKEE